MLDAISQLDGRVIWFGESRQWWYADWGLDGVHPVRHANHVRSRHGVGHVRYDSAAAVSAKRINEVLEMTPTMIDEGNKPPIVKKERSSLIVSRSVTQELRHPSYPISALRHTR